jgi:hypothetical protein
MDRIARNKLIEKPKPLLGKREASETLLLTPGDGTQALGSLVSTFLEQ